MEYFLLHTIQLRNSYSNNIKLKFRPYQNKGNLTPDFKLEHMLCIRAVMSCTSVRIQLTFLSEKLRVGSIRFEINL